MQALWDKLEPVADGLTQEGRELGRAALAARPIENCALVALAGEALADRFRYWRGASGRRYVFSVHEPASCPAYEDAVLAIVAYVGDERRIASIVDTGALPQVAVARIAELAASFGPSAECHIHLLAASRAERAAVIEDLRST